MKLLRRWSPGALVVVALTTAAWSAGCGTPPEPRAVGATEYALDIHPDLSCTVHLHPNPGNPGVNFLGADASCDGGRYRVAIQCHLVGPPPTTREVDGPIVNSSATSSANCPRGFVVNDISDVSVQFF